MRTVVLPGGETVPALGQGTWYMGERRGEAAREAAALRLGVDLGMTLIDTAEMYASGGAEEVVAQAVSGIRDRVFIVSKVLPQNASRSGVPAACERSLKRLRTDRIDLYLLHWRGGHPLAETVAAFEALKAAGKIRYWGVSNFDTGDMEELFRRAGGRGMCGQSGAVSSGQPGNRIRPAALVLRARHSGDGVFASGAHVRRLLGSRALQAVARRHDATPAQVAIAWGMRSGRVISIPKAADVAHVRENAGAAAIELTAEDLAAIDEVHRPPSRKAGLDLL